MPSLYFSMLLNRTTSIIIVKKNIRKIQKTPLQNLTIQYSAAKIFVNIEFECQDLILI